MKNALVCAALLLAACGKTDNGIKAGEAAQPSSGATASLTGARVNFAPNPAPGEWTMQGRDFANTRYSPLTQITTANVARLQVAWTFSDGVLHGHEGAPVVVNNMMYVVTPWPDIAYALDLTKAGSPIKWKFEPNPTPLAQGKACCDIVNRGWTYAQGKLIYNLLDDHTIAIDANTGKELWRTKMANVEDGVTMTMAPLVVKNKVYVGNSGGELGVQGWIAALDINTGKEIWRAYSVGPDSMVKIGPNFHPFYSWLKGKDLGVTTWPKDMWKHGTGAVWGWITYDPDLNLIYYGTSNPGPRVPAQRPGLNLFTSTVFARDADTGDARWAYTFTPHDQWDYDGVNENVLIDLPFNGRLRKVLVHLDRNGFGYTIDRTTGEVLVAKPFGFLNWATGVDLKTGLPQVVPDMQPKPNVSLPNICPPDIGDKDQQPSAFSPRTGLLYASIQNICMDLIDHEVSYIAGTPYDGMEMKRHAGPGGNWGEFIAWNPATGQKVWGIKEKFMTYSGVLVTAGDVAFYGTADGWFRAVDARNGNVLWSQKLGSGIVSSPIAYLGPDGRQYIAITAGVGGAAMVSQAMPGFPARGGTVYVFSIDGQSINSGPGMRETDAGAAAAQTDQTISGRR